MRRRVPSPVFALLGAVCIANACSVADKEDYSYQNAGKAGAGQGGARTGGAGGSSGGRGGSNSGLGGAAEAGMGGSAGATTEGGSAQGGASGGSLGGSGNAGVPSSGGDSGAPSAGSAGEGQAGAGGASVDCTTGYHLCPTTGVCAANNDASACGASCTKCAAPSGGKAICQNGACGIDCGSNAACGSTCAVLASDAANCGACGHDCGAGATCAAGVCSPANLTATPQNVSGGVAVDASGIYFGDGTKIVTCPLDGCTLAPKQVWTASYVRQITAGQGTVAWVGLTDTGRTAVNKCTPSSCSPVTVASGDQVNTLDSPKIIGKSLFYHINAYGVPAYVADHIQCSALATGGCAGMTSYVGKAPFASDGTTLAYVPTIMDAPANFVACPLSAATCTPTNLASTSGVIAAAAHQGTFYMAWSGLVGPNPTRTIQTCPLSGCTSATKLINTSASETVVEVVADDSGVYWAYGGDSGSIWMCPAGGCVGGARMVAENQANPFSLSLYGKFVYWGAKGLSADPTAAGSFGLRRAAKPLVQ